MMQSSASFLLLLLASSSPSAVDAWAPAKHPAPSELPKALEFAERAWKFPHPDQISGTDNSDTNKIASQTVHKLEESEHALEQRRYLWSKPTPATELDDQSLSCMEDSDQYYFDGHLSNSLRWPTRQAFLASLPPKQPHLEIEMVEDNIEDCEEPYFDSTGDELCWATAGAAAVVHGATMEPEPEAAAVVSLEEEEEECEHTYFDRIGGEELCWANLMSVAETLEATKRLTDHLTTTHVSGHEMADEDDDCDEPYYDDTGDVLCWAI